MNTLVNVFLKISIHPHTKGCNLGVAAEVPATPDADIFYQPITVPEGFPLELFDSLEAFYSFKYMWGMSPLSKEVLPLEWQLVLAERISSADNLCKISDLLVSGLRGKVRSTYRLNLIEQVKDWINTPAGELKYSLPLSPRQLETISKPYGHYKKAAARIYHGGNAVWA